MYEELGKMGGWLFIFIIVNLNVVVVFNGGELLFFVKIRIEYCLGFLKLIVCVNDSEFVFEFNLNVLLGFVRRVYFICSKRSLFGFCVVIL